MSIFRYILVILLVNGEDRILRHCHEKASGDVTSISTQKVFRFLVAFFAMKISLSVISSTLMIKIGFNQMDRLEGVD